METEASPLRHVKMVTHRNDVLFLLAVRFHRRKFPAAEPKHGVQLRLVPRPGTDILLCEVSTVFRTID